jgi:hypothetical protein
MVVIFPLTGDPRELHERDPHIITSQMVDTLRGLQEKLLAIGGRCVHFMYPDLVQEHQIARTRKLIRTASVITTPVHLGSVKRADPGSSALREHITPGCYRYIGYAMDHLGVWFYHTWVGDDAKIIETTLSEPAIAYWGMRVVPLPPMHRA